VTTPTIFKSIAIGASVIGGVWTAAPYVSDLHDWHSHKRTMIEMIDDRANDLTRIHTLEAKVQALEIKNHSYDITNDSLRLCIRVLSHGKNPKDSIFIQTYSGWKKFHRNTEWVWRRDPDK